MSAPVHTVSEVKKEEEFIFSDSYGITVRLISGKDLVASDLNGKSDPYVKLNIDGVEKRKSSTQLKTLNPVWNETFTFVFNSKPLKIDFLVKDWDQLGSNDAIGEGELLLSSVYASKEQVVEVDIPLTKVKHGSLRVRVQAHVIPHVIGRSSDELNKLNSIDSLHSLIDLTVVSASNLHSPEIFSKSDAFAVVSFGLQSFRTNVVHHSNAPVFDQICPIWTSTSSFEHILKVSIFDHESARAPHFMGSVFLQPSQLEPNKEHILDLPLLADEPATDAELGECLSKMALDHKASPATATGAKAPSSLRLKLTVKSRAVVENEFYDLLISTYDSDGNGLLSETELAHMVSTVGSTVTDDELHIAFAETDTTKTGNLDKSGLKRLFHHKLFVSKDFLRTLHAIMIHGSDALQSLMFKNFIYHAHNGETVEGKGVDSADPTVDNNNTKILVQDRATGMIVQENIPGYIKSALKLMYRSVGGRSVTHSDSIRATMRSLTLKQGPKMDSLKSAHKIPDFVKTHKLNISEIEKPLCEYRTFNEFFFRKLKPEARVCAGLGDNKIAVSPADCRLMLFDSLEEGQKLWIKGKNFCIANLLAGYDKSGELSKKFNGASLVIARLAPQDYHRWHYPVGGVVSKRFPISGDYNTVNPIAIRKEVDVYTENKRTICPIETKEFGTVLLIAVAAAMVGSINFNDCSCNKSAFVAGQYSCADGVCQVGKRVNKFDQHGYFAFGGSTTLVLFQAGSILFDSDLKTNSNNQLETLVKVGGRLGVATGKSAK